MGTLSLPSSVSHSLIGRIQLRVHREHAACNHTQCSSHRGRQCSQRAHTHTHTHTHTWPYTSASVQTTVVGMQSHLACDHTWHAITLAHVTRCLCLSSSCDACSSHHGDKETHACHEEEANRVMHTDTHTMHTSMHTPLVMSACAQRTHVCKGTHTHTHTERETHTQRHTHRGFAFYPACLYAFLPMSACFVLS